MLILVGPRVYLFYFGLISVLVVRSGKLSTHSQICLSSAAVGEFPVSYGVVDSTFTLLHLLIKSTYLLRH